jgi:hypothetical protein
MNAPEAKSDSALISITALRKQIGEALRPIRVALHSTEDGSHEPVDFMGYRFVGSRLWRGPASKFAWYANYTGTPDTERAERWPTRQYGCISGTLEECAAQMHSRLRNECRARASIGREEAK